MSSARRPRKSFPKVTKPTIGITVEVNTSGRDDYLNRLIRRANRAQGYETKGDPYEWHYTYGDKSGTVIAGHRGEARGLIKKQLGVKKRLPSEVEIERGNRCLGLTN